MFEKFSLSARRAVFWARSEAGRLGSDAIEPKHLLLGFLTEDQGEEGRAQLMPHRTRDQAWAVELEFPPHKPFFSGEEASKLRTLVVTAATVRQPRSEQEDMPVTKPSVRALVAAEEHAGAASVTLLHILWGLVDDEENGVSDLLKSNGVTAKRVEDAIRRVQSG